jgi:flagellar protein FliS
MATPTTTAPQAYLRNKLLSATPAELRLMLIDGAIRFSTQARAGYEARDFEAAYEGTTKAQAILMELMNALRPDQAPELCARLSSLYTYMYSNLVKASSTRELALVDEVISLLRYERETWELCMGELAKENRAASGMRAVPSVVPTTAPDSRARISIVG